MKAAMVLQASRLALVELLVAGGILTLGVPITVDAFHRLGFEARLDAAVDADKRGAAPREAVTQIDHEAPRTAVEHKDLAFALLTLSDNSTRSQDERLILVDRASTQFRDYLTKVPGDGAAWAGLASAEFARGDTGRAVSALKASILASPWSQSLVAWRCGLGIDLFNELDDEERELMKGQVRLQAQRSPTALVDIVARRRAARIARILLASSPDELIAFETELAKRK